MQSIGLGDSSNLQLLHTGQDQAAPHISGRFTAVVFDLLLPSVSPCTSNFSIRKHEFMDDAISGTLFNLDLAILKRYTACHLCQLIFREFSKVSRTSREAWLSSYSLSTNDLREAG